MYRVCKGRSYSSYGAGRDLCCQRLIMLYSLSHLPVGSHYNLKEAVTRMYLLKIRAKLWSRKGKPWKAGLVLP